MKRLVILTLTAFLTSGVALGRNVKGSGSKSSSVPGNDGRVGTVATVDEMGKCADLLGLSLQCAQQCEASVTIGTEVGTEVGTDGAKVNCKVSTSGTVGGSCNFSGSASDMRIANQCVACLRSTFSSPGATNGCQNSMNGTPVLENGPPRGIRCNYITPSGTLCTFNRPK